MASKIVKDIDITNKPIKCGLCFQKLTIVEYDDAYYIQQCDCNAEDVMSNEDREEIYNDGYDEGLSDGEALSDDKLEEARNEGFKNGKAKSCEEEVDLAHETGHSEGYDLARREGYENASQDGFDEGYRDGSESGYREGFGEGFSEGQEEGYENGFADGQED